MITVAITFDAHALGREEYDKIAQSGRVIGASGLLNLRWEEFSALEAARELDLHDVAWEATRDDTPGTLTCIIRYEDVPLPELEGRLQGPSVLEYETYDGRTSRSITHGNRRAPHNGD